MQNHYNNLKFGHKCTIKWNKYQLKVIKETQKQCLDYFIDPGFQGVNRFSLYHLKTMHIKQAIRHFVPTVEIKNHNVMIDGRNLFDLSFFRK